MGAPLQNCHWSINDNFPKHHWHLLLYKTVIYQSMTVLKGIKTCPWVHLYRNCHWSMTFFKSVIDQWQFLKLSLIDQWQFLKLSLIDQWQFWKVTRPVHGCTFTKLSLIDQWQFPQTPLGYLAPLQNCHWLINDNFLKHHWPTWHLYKIVIDWSMTFFRNCHWSINGSF